jgi:hypothetical protein
MLLPWNRLNAASYRKLILASALLSITTTAANAALTVDGGVHYLLPNSRHRIAVAVSGGDRIVGLNFVAQIGDGGPVNGGVDQHPTVVSGDIIGPGTIFYGNNVGDSPTPTGNLIWTDSTAVTNPLNNSIPAQGTIAYLTIDTTGMAAGSNPYALRLQNVAANIYGGAGLSTNFVTVNPASILDGAIYITNLHGMAWNANANGNWTDATWSGTPSTFPDYTADVTMTKPFTVTVRGEQEANSLSLSGNSKLVVSNDSANPKNSLTVFAGTTCAAGSQIEVDGILKAQNISLQGVFNVTNGGTAVAAAISGTGSISVGGGTGNSTLTATSIRASTLIIGGSGLAAADTSMVIPEPGTFLMLGSLLPIFLAWSTFRRETR